jgi:hypothetical protein
MEYAVRIISSTHPKNDLVTVREHKSKPHQKVEAVDDCQGKSQPKYRVAGQRIEAPFRGGEAGQFHNAAHHATIMANRERICVCKWITD